MAGLLRPATFLIGLLSLLLAFPSLDNGLTERFLPSPLRNLPRTIRVLGIFRTPSNTPVANPSDFVTIPDTPHCEDLHYYEPSNLLFTACEASVDTRYSWFPPLSIFKDPSVATESNRGSLHVIDPATMKSTKLALDGFRGPFVTHGIDVISDPERPEGEAVYIFAINHRPDTEVPGKSHSQVEIFHHVIGASSARWIRSVWDPMIRTPNDLVAVSPKEFYVTNDHHYVKGKMRQLEDMHFAAAWTDTVRVTLDKLEGAKDDRCCVHASVALEGMHNNNGLGHGSAADEVVVVNCVSGIMNIAKVVGGKIAIKQSLKHDSTIDNPSYFRDPYADEGLDGSAYLVAGLTRGVDAHGAVDVKHSSEAKLLPVMVWRTKVNKTGKSMTELVFEDDGNRISGAATAVQVAIDPELEGGQRKAWLFVTGFVSRNVVAVKVDV